MHAHLERGPEVDSAADEEADLARLRRVQLVQWAMVAAAAIIRRIRAELWIAQLLAAQGPVNKEPKGGLLRPLPIQKFGSRSSWKPASSASMAALTATAWWMIGTSPA